MARAYKHAFGRDYGHKWGLKVALSVTFFGQIIIINISMARAYNHAFVRDYGHRWGLKVLLSVTFFA